MCYTRHEIYVIWLLVQWKPVIRTSLGVEKCSYNRYVLINGVLITGFYCIIKNSVLPVVLDISTYLPQHLGPLT